MSKGEVTYPDVTVKLIGESGNAFSLIGLTAEAIKRAEGMEAGSAFVTKAMDQPSYDALLAFIQRTVHVR